LAAQCGGIDLNPRIGVNFKNQPETRALSILLENKVKESVWEIRFRKADFSRPLGQDIFYHDSTKIWRGISGVLIPKT